LAAEATECAAEQEAFWPLHDLIFADNRNLTNEKLAGFAEQLDLDVEAFTACLESGKYNAFVNTQTQFGQSIGVRSTPSFLVNGRPLVGAQSFAVFEQYVEEELSKK
jgi:protein-disulfide isomerase